ncbi:uncharacterized protein EV420DRAFT_1171020 [Desarmillaria tabescens]|uniref:Uncharacterized protein n=1 Tax=Armillaria tabescens TaxID=1929756 RepID=A0AA39JCL4_ARMTA|nr:uncharacterized protein EV420DRAFT_1171020 [Desarmillaria tabescens]KAK0439515.1 hypothetical protein EV420DRAFT_1171020 [Desarmillaria tabescens]
MRQSAAFSLPTTTIAIHKRHDYSSFDSDLYPTADPRTSPRLPEPVPNQETTAEISAYEQETVESQVSGLKWKTTAMKHSPHQENKDTAGKHTGLSQYHFQPTAFFYFRRGRPNAFPVGCYRHSWNQAVLATLPHFRVRGPARTLYRPPCQLHAFHRVRPCSSRVCPWHRRP